MTNSVNDRNDALMERARRVIPGGVNSPVRAFRAVGGTPRFIQRAQGAYLWDANDQRYIDYIGSWGPMILGHGHPAVLEAVRRAAQDGLSFGAPTEREVELAEEILSLMPSMDMVRLVSSGTEAGMSAIRLARGATGRSKIIKFEGCYHGHADALLVKAGSGLATFGNPTSAGVPPEVVQHTLVLEYNNLTQLEEAFALHGRDLACLIIEPIAGFAPDITVMGKVIGGGMPLAAFGGKRDVMEQLAPLGPVYQAGTLSGNPVATACGLATLREIRKPGFFEALSARTCALVDGLRAAAQEQGVPFCADSEGGLFGFFLLPRLPQNYREVMQSDAARFNRFFHSLLSRGVYVAPALYEASFVSAAHSEDDIAATLQAARAAFRELA